MAKYSVNTRPSHLYDFVGHPYKKDGYYYGFAPPSIVVITSSNLLFICGSGTDAKLDDLAHTLGLTLGAKKEKET